jgi:hypothetical protein
MAFLPLFDFFPMHLVKLYGWTLIPLGTTGLPVGEVHAKGGLHSDRIGTPVLSSAPSSVCTMKVCEDFLATAGIDHEVAEIFDAVAVPSIFTL